MFTWFNVPMNDTVVLHTDESTRHTMTQHSHNSCRNRFPYLNRPLPDLSEARLHLLHAQDSLATEGEVSIQRDDVVIAPQFT